MTTQDYLTKLLQHSGVDADQLQVEMTEADDQIIANVTVSAEDSGLLIGFHGDTLNAIQRLTRIVCQEQLGEKRFILNINQYREQREEKLRAMVAKAAERVQESGEPYTFSYLPANERFVIHTALSEMPEFADLESVSEGEGNQRVLIIRTKQS